MHACIKAHMHCNIVEQHFQIKVNKYQYGVPLVRKKIKNTHVNGNFKLC